MQVQRFNGYTTKPRIGGAENDGPSKCPGMKLTDIKMQNMFQLAE